MYPNLNVLWAALILSELKKRGIHHFHLAPGRRNAPFALAAEKLGLDVISHYDERSLAFHALGAAPAAIIVTSGTAVANLMPAVVEAHERGLNLILITADRPIERHGVGDWQAIDQEKIFGTFVDVAIDLPTPSEHVSPQALSSQVSRLIVEGPAHLNCRLREPLMEELGPISDAYREKAEELFSKGPKQTLRTARGVVVAGQGGAKALERAEEMGWPLFPCITSGLKTIDHPNIIHNFHHLLDAFTCDVVMHVGGKVISKAYELWMARTRPYLSSRGAFNPAHLEKIADVQALPSKDLAELKSRSDASELRPNPVTELFWGLKGRGLFLGNSLSVRLADHLAPLCGPVEIEANRGAGGIDGAISTACGFARRIGRGVVALIGDLTFLYDLSALALVAASKEPVTLVIINNGGGGLFSLLPLPEGAQARRLIETPHASDLKKAAELYNLPHTYELEHGLEMDVSCIVEWQVDNADLIQLIREPFNELSRHSLH